MVMYIKQQEASKNDFPAGSHKFLIYSFLEIVK